MISGPGVKRGFELPTASPYDIMPTILWLLDLPISRELEGRVLIEAFEPSFVESRKTRWVDSYGPRETQELRASEVDDAMLENLRALGYIE